MLSLFQNALVAQYKNIALSGEDPFEWNVRYEDVSRMDDLRFYVYPHKVGLDKRKIIAFCETFDILYRNQEYGALRRLYEIVWTKTSLVVNVWLVLKKLAGLDIHCDVYCKTIAGLIQGDSSVIQSVRNETRHRKIDIDLVPILNYIRHGEIPISNASHINSLLQYRDFISSSCYQYTVKLVIKVLNARKMPIIKNKYISSFHYNNVKDTLSKFVDYLNS